MKSNRESGEGYSDIMIRSEEDETGIIIEVKYAENARYDAACAEALEQIRKKEYAGELRKEGCRTIYKYAIACYRKKCRVAVETV